MLEMKHKFPARRSRRAFLLLVVVGLLAVLLAVVVGFLSFARGEVTSVAHLRDKTDCFNIAESAQDWMITNICGDLLDASGRYLTAASGNKGYVSVSRGNDGQWWYQMFEPGTVTANPLMSGDTRYETKWVYLPEGYFNTPALRGRFCVLLTDPNMALNMNDWGEDCMPSQAQHAHMIMDTKGPQFAEQQRGTKASLAGWGDVWANSTWNYTGGYSNYPMLPHRYLDCWFASSRTILHEYNLNLFSSYKRVTTNTASFLPSYHWQQTLGISALEEKIDTGWNYSFYTTGQNYMSGADYFGAQWAAYVDPDTGRSPVNVNSVDNNYTSGYPHYYALQTMYPRTLHAVFNIEALRRIVKVGKFRFRNNTQPGLIVPPTDTTAYSEMDARVLYDADLLTNPAKLPPEFDPTTAVPAEIRIPAPHWLPAPLDADIVMATKDDVVREMKKYVEELRTRVAYQYQETLARYFQAFYFNKYWWRYADGTRTYAKYQPAKAIWPWPYYFGAVGDTYPQYAAKVMGAAEAARVQWHAKNYDNTTARFPYGLEEFRLKVKEDLLAMTTNNTIDPIAAWTKYRYRSGLPKDGGEYVNFDEDGDADIAIGKLDLRTASAVWDNIVPGKGVLFPNDPSAGVRDPISELYALRLGRDENTEKDYVSNYYCFLNPTNTAGKIGWEKGLDIVLNAAPDGPWVKRAEVPDRQLAFGPDWFSTELTTGTTTFAMIVNAQIVEASTVAADPAKPRVLFHTQRYVLFEICPDIKVEETGETGTAIGLRYYRNNLPRARKLDPDIMDKNCAYLPADNGGTTCPRDWFDYRGLKDSADAAAYYQNPAQNSRRVVIRATYDFVMP